MDYEEAATVKAIGRRYEIPDWVPKHQVPAIFPAMIKANRAVNAVTKSRKNAQQGYNFRGIDQVYDMIHEAFAEAGIVTVPVVLQRRTTPAGKTAKGGDILLTELEMEYWCYAEDGSALVLGPLWAEGLDSSDKGTNKCLSFAQKYAILQTFTVPTSDVAEGDRTTEERRDQRDRQEEELPRDNDNDPLGADMADKVLTAFEALGVTKDRLLAKLGVPELTKLTRAVLPQLATWRDEIHKDKRAAVQIFGEPAAPTTDALNGPPQGT